MSEATIGLVLDCADPEALVSFWAPPLDLSGSATPGP